MSGETIGLLLAINSGILSVAGLITIFISMNSQHNVQQSREILWSIFTLPYKKNLFLEKGAIGQEVFRKFILYEQIITEKNTFLRKIIIFSQMVLTFSIVIWTTIVLNMLIWNPSPLDKGVLLLGLGLALCFLFYFILKILGDLKSISKVGQLPTVDQLLDANLLTNNSNIITLAAVSSRLKILATDIYIGFPIPFKNLMVHISVHNPVDEVDSSTEIVDSQSLADRINNFKKLDPEDFKLLDDDYCYYQISNPQSLGVQNNSFFATVEFLSKQGFVATEFYCEGLNINANKLIVYPYSFVERFVNRQSKLDPFSRYLNSAGDNPLNSEADWINIGKSFKAFLDKE
ncbi:MAG: hypothetical protein Q8912_06960 [Bacillota bacterium]|nr:hypothetical protein [Bacillota bacterium]MDP4160955.1 hypothetical protein [Bacillota bacterium]